MNQDHKKSYSFGFLENVGSPLPERYLICPDCGEHLKQMDIEHFSACPFCNHKFELDEELEDFILEPVVENWIRRQDMDPGEHQIRF